MPQAIEILVINCGSSSLKFEWLVLNESMARTKMRARGEIEKIGKDASCRFEAENAAEVRRAQPIVDLPGAARVVLSWLDTLQPRLRNSVKAVAHRVVHGGQLNRAVIVDADVLAQIEKAGEFAPLHNPPALAVIRLMMTE